MGIVSWVPALKYLKAIVPAVTRSTQKIIMQPYPHITLWGTFCFQILQPFFLPCPPPQVLFFRFNPATIYPHSPLQPTWEVDLLVLKVSPCPASNWISPGVSWPSCCGGWGGFGHCQTLLAVMKNKQRWKPQIRKREQAWSLAAVITGLLN